MDYEVIRSNRRSLSLEVRADGSLLVRAPKRLGAAEVRRFVQSKEAWIQEKQASLARGERAFGGAVLSAEELAQLKAQAQSDFAARLARWAPCVGAAPVRLTIRTQRTRWGSCSAKGAISLNALLMLAPETVRDYVVVHELCHLKEMNHSSRFWAEVARVLPTYARERDWLKENGYALLKRNPTS